MKLLNLNLMSELKNSKWRIQYGGQFFLNPMEIIKNQNIWVLGLLIWIWRKNFNIQNGGHTRILKFKMADKKLINLYMFFNYFYIIYYFEIFYISTFFMTAILGPPYWILKFCRQIWNHTLYKHLITDF